MAASKGKIHVTFKDEAGNLTTRAYQLAGANIAGTVTITELEALGNALVAALQDVVDTGIAGFTVEVACPATAPSSPASGVEMENTAAVSLPLNVVGPSGLTTFAVLSLPGPKIGIFTGTTGQNKNIVDMADADLLALIDLFQSGGTADFMLSDGQSVAASLADASGRRVHRRSRKSRGTRIG